MRFLRLGTIESARHSTCFWTCSSNPSPIPSRLRWICGSGAVRRGCLPSRHRPTNVGCERQRRAIDVGVGDRLRLVAWIRWLVRSIVRTWALPRLASPKAAQVVPVSLNGDLAVAVPRRRDDARFNRTLVRCEVHWGHLARTWRWKSTRWHPTALPHPRRSTPRPHLPCRSLGGSRSVTMQHTRCLTRVGMPLHASQEHLVEVGYGWCRPQGAPAVASIVGQPGFERAAPRHEDNWSHFAWNSRL
ncbi:hypothetical protein H310_10537 [Aphanomyces invadans]|uniref:Uncharacterized protein n=1 Tax=Aphanomyces invadans TaxID=157072 RepID=A0A024TQW2_9STRA|nr:hypothetical protein H310_10537 [Aphanomyces invadans]ETV96384.1 hypothetical protein H310_10537 [Aphanomyces invadans]|eukprot:XP_008875176.1 hypothetical protein H310_10537 [Aphanomyces invadans]